MKDQLKVARTLREQLTRHQRIVDLLKYKLGEDRLDMVGGQLIIFLDMVEQRRVLQVKPLIERTDPLFAILGRVRFFVFCHLSTLWSPCVASGIARAFIPTRRMLNVVWNRCSRLA